VNFHAITHSLIFSHSRAAGNNQEKAMNRFNDKVVLVTGATAGIGRATAEAFGREGAKLIVTGRNVAAGESLIAELKHNGTEAYFVAGDASQEATAQAWVDAALERLGRLDVAVNNAGVEGELGPVTAQTEANYDHVFDINVKGLLFALKHQVPALIGHGGAIVNVSSMVGAVGMAGASVYTASKHAINGLTRSVALEVARSGVRVNAVAPGSIATQMLERFTGGSKEAQSGLAGAHPVGRLGGVEEIAQAILFLASEDAKFITGSVLAIDGGYTAQ
jgi:NAD(P)-dependent dehydrogenase (short-subunit alcohol dehydrogenase family)